MVHAWTIPGVSWDSGLVHGNPGILGQGVAYIATLYILRVFLYGGQSQECPGMVWLHGNPGILGQGGSLETLLYTVHVHGGQSQKCPGKVCMVTWESRDTWTGGSLATLLHILWLHGNPGTLGQGGSLATLYMDTVRST